VGPVTWEPEPWEGTKHRCIFVKLTNPEDPNGSGWDSNWDNNIGWRNFAVEGLKRTIIDGLVYYRATIDLKFGNPDTGSVHDVFLDLSLEDWPSPWTFELTSPDTLVQLSDTEYVFYEMRPWQVNDVTLTVLALECTHIDTGSVHIIGTMDGNPIGGVSVQLVPPKLPRGDVDGDGVISITDVVYLINYLLKDGPEPVPLETGDVNCDGVVDIVDLVYLINYLFKGGPPPCDP